jgi:hypothetical protein
MRRLHLVAAVALVLGLFASACLVGGCKSDPHDTHVRSNVSAAR